METYVVWKKSIFALSCCFVFLIIGCSSKDQQVKHDNNKNISIDKSITTDKTNNIGENTNTEKALNNSETNNEDNKIDENGIKDFVLKFMSAIKDDDSTAFKSLIDKYGIFSMTYYIDQRDPNRVIHIFKDKIRDDLVLVNSEDIVGITLSTMFAGNSELQPIDIPINMSQNPRNISFNVDWKSNDESTITPKMDDIFETCRKINFINNEYIPQVFVLRDNMYAFAQSKGVLEPKLEFTGDWVIFEKVGNEYYLRAVIQIE